MNVTRTVKETFKQNNEAILQFSDDSSSFWKVKNLIWYSVLTATIFYWFFISIRHFISTGLMLHTSNIYFLSLNGFI